MNQSPTNAVSASSPVPTDAELLALHTRFAPVIHHRALRILGNPELAQDAVQETFARVIVAWPSFRREASPTTWIYAITTRWCLNQLRNTSTRARLRSQHGHELAGDDAAWDRDPVEAELVRNLLADCDEQTQQVVIHTYFDDMTREEVAQAVGVSVPTVRKRLDAFIERARRTSGVVFAGAAALFALLWGLG